MKFRMRLKESNKIEFKKSTAELKKALEDLCAFANSGEGAVYFGIDDKGIVIGQNVSDATIKKVTTTILSTITPRLYPTITVETIDNHSILKIEIKSNPDKPYQFKGVYFKRVGTSNAYLTSAEVEQMLFDKEHAKQRFDQLPIKNFTDKIDTKVLNWFLKTAKQERGLNLGTGNKKQEILTKLELLAGEEQTLASILAFSNKGQKYFPNAGVKCAVFAGTDKTYPILDTIWIQKNIFEQVSDCQQFFIEKARKTSFIDPVSARRQWEYHWPLQALREAVANAIAHRDYRIPSDIDVLLFDDRLEIWSPGGLPDGITVKKLNKPHKSFQRNPLIARLLYLVGYAESFGTGIQKMNQMLQEANLPLPEYKNDDGDFIVTFRKQTAAIEQVTTEVTTEDAGVNVGLKLSEPLNGPLNGPLNEPLKSLLDAIIKNPFESKDILADKLDRSRSTITRQIQKLKKRKLIKRVGSDKDGYWEIIDEGK